MAVRYFLVTGTPSRPSGAIYHDHRPRAAHPGVLGSAILFGPAEVPPWLEQASLAQIMTVWREGGTLEKPKRKVRT